MTGVRWVPADGVSGLRRLAARLRLPASAPTTDEAGHHHATWLELFFDIIFAFALTAVVDRLGNVSMPRLADVLTVCGLFVMVQWAWLGQVYYDTRYDPDDGPHRLMVLVALAGAGAMTLGVGRVPDSVLLPVGYLIVRGVLLLLYLRARSAVASAREVTGVYLTGFGIGWLVWLGSLLTPPAVRPALWTTAVCIELATPWLGVRRLSRWPVDTEHLPERTGQFAIIILGSSALANVLNAVPNRPSPHTILAAAVAFAVPAAVWWIYTTFITAGLAGSRLGGGQTYTYLNIPMSGALLILGWSLGQVVRLVSAGAQSVPGALRLMLAASILLWMLCGIGLSWLAVNRPNARRLAIFGYGMGSITLIALAARRPLLLLVLVSAAIALYALLVTRRMTAVSGGRVAPRHQPAKTT
jgi:low temperature requirement protein LtrA